MHATRANALMDGQETTVIRVRRDGRELILGDTITNMQCTRENVGTLWNEPEIMATSKQKCFHS